MADEEGIQKGIVVEAVTSGIKRLTTSEVADILWECYDGDEMEDLMAAIELAEPNEEADI